MVAVLNVTTGAECRLYIEMKRAEQLLPAVCFITLSFLLAAGYVAELIKLVLECVWAFCCLCSII